jgi:hypothetical protein
MDANSWPRGPWAHGRGLQADQKTSLAMGRAIFNTYFADAPARIGDQDRKAEDHRNLR